MRRFQTYYQHWRNRVDPPELGSEEKSNYRVPLTQWQVFAKVGRNHGQAHRPGRSKAREEDRPLHDLAGVQFHETGQSHHRVLIPLILFGRSHAYAPWDPDVFDAPMDDGSTKQMLHYDGPLFEPLWPDDFIVPAEDVDSLVTRKDDRRTHAQYAPRCSRNRENILTYT